MNGIAGRGGEKFELGKKRKRGEIISALKKIDGEKIRILEDYLLLHSIMLLVLS